MQVAELQLQLAQAHAAAQASHAVTKTSHAATPQTASLMATVTAGVAAAGAEAAGGAVTVSIGTAAAWSSTGLDGPSTAPAAQCRPEGQIRSEIEQGVLRDLKSHATVQYIQQLEEDLARYCMLAPATVLCTVQAAIAGWPGKLLSKHA